MPSVPCICTLHIFHILFGSFLLFGGIAEVSRIDLTILRPHYLVDFLRGRRYGSFQLSVWAFGRPPHRKQGRYIGCFDPPSQHRCTIGFAAISFLILLLVLLVALLFVRLVPFIVHRSHSSQDRAHQNVVSDVVFFSRFLEFR